MYQIFRQAVNWREDYDTEPAQKIIFRVRSYPTICPLLFQQKLITIGVNRISRNPMYLALLLVLNANICDECIELCHQILIDDAKEYGT